MALTRTTARSTSKLRACVVAVLAATLVGTIAHSAPANAAASLSWQAPVLIDPSAGLGQIACPSATLCVATDASGNVLTSTDPIGDAATWHDVHVDSNTGCGAEACKFDALSCPTESFCAAADDAGYIFTTTSPATATDDWTSAKVAPPYANALSCPSAQFCVAVDTKGDALTSTNPTGGAGSWHIQHIDSGPCPECSNPLTRPLDAVSCPSVTLCVAGDWEGNVIASSDPTGGGGAWNGAHVDGNRVSGLIGLSRQTAINNVSCPSVSLCVAGDEVGEVLTSQDPTGGASSWRLYHATSPTIVPYATSMFGLTCPSVSFCAGLHAQYGGAAKPGGGFGTVNSEVVYTHEPLAGVAWSSGVIDSTGGLTSLSCPSSSFCAAVDETGHLIIGRVIPVSRRQIQALLSAEIAPPRGATTIRALLHRKALSLPFTLPASGRILIRWTLRRPRGHSPRGVIDLRVAKGQASFSEGVGVAIPIELTRAGAAALRHRRSVRLTATATFTPATGRPIAATKVFTLHQ